MSSLFRSLNTGFSSKRENAIKDAIIESLEESVKEFVYDYERTKEEKLGFCESTSSLCTSLEAIFLHGLQGSFLWQTMTIIAGDVERRPEPSFWSPIMVFMHKEVIEQILSLSQITSETGQCRAWIRCSLNECSLSSYINIMSRNPSSLTPYYKKYALIKDSPRLERIIKLLADIEGTLQCELPCNSSLLNQWPATSLQLSGLWTPTMKSCPIVSGVDASTLVPAATEEAMSIPEPLRTNELFEESITNSPFQRGSYFPVEDINSRINIDNFLKKVDEMEEQETSEVGQDLSEERGSDNSAKNCSNQPDTVTHENMDTEIGFIQGTNSGGNSLSNLMQTSWCSDIRKQESSTNEFQRSLSMTSSTSSLRSPQTDRCSYNSLLRKHERQRQVDWTEVWENFLQQNTSSGSVLDDTADHQKIDNEESELNTSDFELISADTAMNKFDIDELQDMVEKLCNLAREPGLDAQGFVCKSCQHPLGIGYSNFRVCAFSGNYYCDACMSMEPVFIPAKIIYNWDFRKYSVSKKAATFLAEFRTQPFIDLKLLNPDIYNASEAMAEMQALRIRLNFIRAYLFTCTPPKSVSYEELQKIFFGKEYLFTSIHQYSIEDLGMIQRGTLCQQLQKAFKMGEAHILKCPLCSFKGFICEICKSSRILYPFHIETTFRCSACGAVFHSVCLNEKQPCPKCERKHKRDIVINSD